MSGWRNAHLQAEAQETARVNSNVQFIHQKSSTIGATNDIPSTLPNTPAVSVPNMLKQECDEPINYRETINSVKNPPTATYTIKYEIGCLSI